MSTSGMLSGPGSGVLDVTLQVYPALCGWRLEAPAVIEPLMFLSGAAAERQAHHLAESVALAGSDARVVVHDRGRRVIGTTRYFAQDAGPN